MTKKFLTPLRRWRLIVIIIGILFFIPFNGKVHLFDWDEINFAESAREMIVTGDYSTVQINFVPFWEKPPLFIWMQAVSMKIFGINEFGARFPNAVCGIITLLLLFEAGIRLKDYKFGLFWVLSYGAAILPFVYFKSGIIDPWFNLFIFSSIFLAFTCIQQRSHKRSGMISALLSGFLLGLAVLTKGPAALLLFGLSLVIYLVIEQKLRYLKITDFFVFSVVCIITGGAYHIYQAMLGNWQLIVDFFEYQVRLLKTEDAGHGGFLLYHPVVLFFGVFPSSVFAIKAFYTKDLIVNQGFRKLMLILFWVVLIIFTLVKTKIVHYSSLCYFPLTYLAALTLYQTYVKKENLVRFKSITIGAIGIIFSFFPLIIQWLGNNGDFIASLQLIKDDFALACLKTEVHWTGFEFLVGLILLISVIIFLYSKDFTRKVLAIYCGTALFLFFTMLFIVPKIEKYSQGPAIEFISEQKGQPAWVSTLGYKSYAHLFYSNRQHGTVSSYDEREYLLNHDVEMDVYFVVKKNHSDLILKQHPQLTLIKEKGGFALLKRINNQ